MGFDFYGSLWSFSVFAFSFAIDFPFNSIIHQLLICLFPVEIDVIHQNVGDGGVRHEKVQGQVGGVQPVEIRKRDIQGHPFARYQGRALEFN